MNKSFTIAKVARHLLATTVAVLTLGTMASAQVNIALTADTVMHLPCCGPTPPTPGTGTGNPTSTNYGFGPYHYNDNYIPPYPPTAANIPPNPNLNFTYVTSGGQILFVWSNTVSFDKIVIYKASRPINSFELKVGGGASYTTVYTYSNPTNSVADSILFNTPITVNAGDTLMFDNIGGPENNPSTREIQIWSLLPCQNVPGTNAVVASSTTPCFGDMVYLNTMSNVVSAGHSYQWQISTDNVVWNNIPGATQPGYSAQAQGIYYYRVQDLCIASSVTATSPSVQITPTPAMTYVPLGTGYYQGFDALWTQGCAAAPFGQAAPAPEWTNYPSAGDSSWRREGPPPTNPHTPLTVSGWTGSGGQYGAPQSGGYSARLHTSAMGINIPGNLDVYLNLGAPTPAGDKQLYFYMINALSGLPSGDSLKVLMSVDSGLTWTFLAGYDTATAWRKKSVTIQSNSPKTILRFQGVKSIASNGTDIGLDSVFVAPPCSGTVVAGNITMPATTLACAGATFNMTTIGATMAGNLVYAWEYSTNNGGTWNPVNGGIGSNTHNFTTPPLYDTTQFRLRLQCGATGAPAYSNVITINIAKQPVYATIPHSESFESWISSCKSSTPVGCTSCDNDVPSIHWANWPVSGNQSWRRDDQGTTAVLWTSPNNGILPAAAGKAHGLRAARFHSSAATTGAAGSLDLLVNLSTYPGTKELRFASNNLNGNDSLGVSYSTDGGINFIPLTTIFSNASAPTSGWVYTTLPLPTSSATTVIRFTGYGEFGNASDIYLDTVTVIPACSGTPNPGVVSLDTPCANANFTLHLQNSTFAGSLAYQWQDSIPGVSATFTDIPGANSQSFTDNINVNKYYRVRVTCTASNQSAFTAARYIALASFYYCYCASFATNPTGADIGNVTIMRLPGQGLALNNGVATPLNTNATANKVYTDFRKTLTPPVVLYHDSTYAFFVTQINNAAFAAASVGLWLDTNRNGIFEPTERIITKNTSASSNPPQVVSDTLQLTIDTSFVGITGMRVTIEQPVNSAMGPCGNYPNGETEDYLVELRASPCNGPVNPGVAYASDTSGCIGYAITLVDTTHEEYRSDIGWRWQYSPDGFSWADIAGSNNRDTIVHILTGQTYFRLMMLCLNTLDTTFSNVLKVSMNSPFQCYCFSQADGGVLDSSDIGSFMLDSLVINGTGPHVKNATAFRSRTDYTNLPIIHLFRNTKYQLKVYHILRSANHADAYITLFMDLNNDLMYNTGPTYTEKVWSGFTTASNFLITDSVFIPATTIISVKTGMRLILNNNTSPNVPSDSACGPYTSGETEDYVVMFHDSAMVVAPGYGNISQLLLYPNPTEGKFSISFMAKQSVEKATVTVTNITGQKVLQQQYTKPGKQMDEEFDLSGMPRGVYLVELLADNEKLVRKVVVK